MVLSTLFKPQRGGNALFWNVIDQTRQSVLKQILESDPVPGSYLAGRTAFALLLGHRESIDLMVLNEQYQLDQLSAKNTVMIGQMNLFPDDTSRKGMFDRTPDEHIGGHKA
jgi:hypothetical protein